MADLHEKEPIVTKELQEGHSLVREQYAPDFLQTKVETVQLQWDDVSTQAQEKHEILKVCSVQVIITEMLLNDNYDRIKLT